MGLPTSGKPRASDVVDWAKWLAAGHRRVDVDGRFGNQCWDLPNYIFNRYWGFRTWGNANAMARRDNYPNRSFKIYKNTASFIPRPGDIAVWTGGQFGHTAIVIGPSTKSYFYSVDQNWINSNAYSGSPSAKIKHGYNELGQMYFVRPPYKAEKKTKTNPSGSSKSPKPTVKEETEPTTKKVWKTVKEITVSSSDVEPTYPSYIYHFIVTGNRMASDPKGITVKNANTMSSVEDLYNDRKKYMSDREYPHFFIDRNHIWMPRRIIFDVPSDPGNIVIEVCEDFSASKNDFILNEIHAIILGVRRMKEYKIPMKRSRIKIDPQIWRSLYEHASWDMVVNGTPKSSSYDTLQKALIGLYSKRNELLSSIPKSSVKTSKIRVEVKNKNNGNINSSTAKSSSSSSSSTSKATSKPKTTVVHSKYTFNNAVNIQMRTNPQINYGNSWYSASRGATLNAMNSLKIWNSASQKYQMLNLGKYQGVSVSKLNDILRGKGTLSGQGKAFAYACKKYNINEIYLIAHAFLESGYGTSYFSNGKAGVYNFFGIGAFDANPNNAIAFARNRGWTSASKGIIGGARFVKEDYISKGQQTLYRMRWNPTHPGTHQYATDVRWAQHQASTIYNLYKKIGLKGIYFLRDRYK